MMLFYTLRGIVLVSIFVTQITSWTTDIKGNLNKDVFIPYIEEWNSKLPVNHVKCIVRRYSLGRTVETELKPDQRYKFEKSGLLIRNVKMEDTGYYKCDSDYNEQNKTKTHTTEVKLHIVIAGCEFSNDFCDFTNERSKWRRSSSELSPHTGLSKEALICQMKSEDVPIEYTTYQHTGFFIHPKADEEEEIILRSATLPFGDMDCELDGRVELDSLIYGSSNASINAYGILKDGREAFRNTVGAKHHNKWIHDKFSYNPFP
ncbi:unnamed protein product, partial [Owenia fusiformis]